MERRAMKPSTIPPTMVAVPVMADEVTNDGDAPLAMAAIRAVQAGSKSAPLEYPPTFLHVRVPTAMESQKSNGNYLRYILEIK